MRRRTLLSSIAATVTVGVAGCSGNGGDSEPTGSTADGADVSPVSVSGENYGSESAVNTLTLRYATATTAEVDPPDAPGSEPDSGNKFVVLHAQVSVDRRVDRPLDVYGTAIGLRADGVIYDGQPILSLPELSQTVEPGATYDAWERYEVPEGVTEATLVGVDVRAWFNQSTRIVFERDESVSATLPQ